MTKHERANFGSKLGVILATAGSAVGLGNVWRFPYMTGENGGAVFILLYIGCVLVLGLPCIISEFIIGRHGAANTYGAYSRVAKGSAWRWVGFLSVLTGFLITGYYCVVSGWCLQYIMGSMLGHLNGDKTHIHEYFLEFSSSPVKPVLWTALMLLGAHIVIVRGVRNGIERASKILMPLLFILLVIIVVASCCLPNADRGIRFLFHPDFSKLDANVFLGALGQSFYSMSIGMGCVCTYASYFSRETNLPKSAVQIGIIDTLVAILAGLMIFPAAFSVGISPDSGAPLVFITLPNVFQKAFVTMPVVGSIISLAFYGLLALAALTSLISLQEVSTAFVHEEFRLSRARAATCVTVGCLVIGVFCSLSLGACDGLQLYGMPLFDIFDFVTGQVFLPVVGLLTCLFIGWRVPRSLVYDEFTNGGMLKGSFFALYYFSVRFVCPISILLVFLHQFNII